LGLSPKVKGTRVERTGVKVRTDTIIPNEKKRGEESQANVRSPELRKGQKRMEESCGGGGPDSSHPPRYLGMIYTKGGKSEKKKKKREGSGLRKRAIFWGGEKRKGEADGKGGTKRAKKEGKMTLRKEQYEHFSGGGAEKSSRLRRRNFGR